MTGATKRMSADEKRKVILDIYHKTKAVYTEKEILALATKAGVNANTVADMNQSLIDDGLVDKEKIGGTNYFWSFPAKKDRMLQIQYNNTMEQIKVLEQEIIDVNTALIEAQRGREDDTTDCDNANSSKVEGDKENVNERASSNTDSNGQEENIVKKNEHDIDIDVLPPAKKVKVMSRKEKLKRLDEIERIKVAALAELEKCKENDPQAIADLEKERTLVHQAAVRWTDNIFNCQSYLIKKRGMNKKDTYKLLGITDSFDYPEDKLPK